MKKEIIINVLSSLIVSGITTSALFIYANIKKIFLNLQIFILKA